MLTSRKALFDEPAVRNVVVPELSLVHALRLVRLEAGQRHLRDVAEASDDELQPIYDTVGGNPLALKLVVGQLYLLPLAHVLEDMTEARGKRVDELYRFIYLAILASAFAGGSTGAGVDAAVCPGRRQPGEHRARELR